MNIKTLEENMSVVADQIVEITIRGERVFTISFEGENKEAVEKITKYLGSNVKSIESEYDEECDHTCIWFAA